MSHDDATDGDREPVFLDGTLVLVGCGNAKRDPADPDDVAAATTAPGETTGTVPGGKTGPAWPAQDLYTSAYFSLKADFAQTATEWADDHDTPAWSILSAKHGVANPNREVTPYDTTVADLGADPTNPDHRVDNPNGLRRPDGRQVVTEMDMWARQVAHDLTRWVAQFRPDDGRPWENEANELLILAGRDYINALQERGVFEYGTARMGGNPNDGVKFPLKVRGLFDNIGANGNGQQMAWLSDDVDRMEKGLPQRHPAEQVTLAEGT